ncbi:kinase-like protein, partial [Aureobasidium melanogenum]
MSFASGGLTGRNGRVNNVSRASCDEQPRTNRHASWGRVPEYDEGDRELDTMYLYNRLMLSPSGLAGSSSKGNSPLFGWCRLTSTYQDDTTTPHIDLATTRATTARLHKITATVTGRLDMFQAHLGDKLLVVEVVLNLLTKLIIRVKSVCESKIGDDDIAVAVQQQVLQLQVAMDNTLLMQVANTRHELCKQPTSRIAYSRMIPMCLSVSTISCSRTMLGCCSPRRIEISRVSRRMSLMATCTPPSFFHPILTLPNSPSPRVCPKMCSWRRWGAAASSGVSIADIEAASACGSSITNLLNMALSSRGRVSGTMCLGDEAWSISFRRACDGLSALNCE